MAIRKSERAAALQSLSFRVTPELRDDLEAAASSKGRSLTSEVLSRLERSFAWEAAHRDVQTMLAESKARIAEIESGNLEAVMRQRGWKPVVGSPYWLPPGAVPQSGFVEMKEPATPPAATKPLDEEAVYRAVLRALRDARSQDPTPDEA